jgi:hypothetical protein
VITEDRIEQSSCHPSIIGVSASLSEIAVQSLRPTFWHPQATWLQANGIDAHAYSGRDDPADRLVVEEVLAANACKAVVATSALGMGYDKPDLAFVVHYQAPDSPVGYYQQVGRVGRALDRAEVILLGGPEDRRIWDYFTTTAFPPGSSFLDYPSPPCRGDSCGIRRRLGHRG